MKENFPPEKRGSFEIVPYPNAGHLIEPPYTPLCRMSYHKLFGMFSFIFVVSSFQYVMSSNPCRFFKYSRETNLKFRNRSSYLFIETYIEKFRLKTYYKIIQLLTIESLDTMWCRQEKNNIDRGEAKPRIFNDILCLCRGIDPFVLRNRQF